MKKLFAVGIFAISSLALAGTVTSTKSFELTLSTPTKVAGVQLKAGQYLVKVKGDTAVFTNQQTAKSFTTPVKTEDNGKKFETTTVDAVKEANTDVVVVKDIKVGGSKIQLDFGEF